MNRLVAERPERPPASGCAEGSRLGVYDDGVIARDAEVGDSCGEHVFGRNPAIRILFKWRTLKGETYLVDRGFLLPWP